MSEDDSVISRRRPWGRWWTPWGKKVFALNLDLDVHRAPVITIQMHATKGQGTATRS